MNNVDIRRPRMEDIKQLNEFFRMVIIDTFTKEGLGEKLDDINEEIKIKEKYLESDFESNGEKRYFLIALDGEKIIGSIEFGPASELISDCTNNAFKELIEVGTVFVHPDHQRIGVGNLLLNKMYFTLHSKGIEEFCLDSGYISAQKIWKKKFGPPDFLLKDFWDEGYDHMIWRIKVSDWI
ncbi:MULTISPECIES: GNAT family N-acetyltransferase [unclassified Bacillus (in: firmicutes)]|uniref:GNAT family N-acetyltransferase n=1 Tax=unclassified Bacillus (in: firmicutes) TaxID=185979 RepID=UPI0008F0FCDD|nr:MULTISPECIES: GNAT family N-acetyltransferase [unclassified Bacillus (in: firmicutes)]SFA85862.1 Acetyltransferase (GNAT) family protein [Bacillus sp. UNCCL13]SFQ83539.1 Acetyltransferase (GNAT) family protein [Bacillus sp. cl95]